MESDEQLAYAAITTSTAVCWSCMILAPRSRLTAMVMRSASPSILGGLAIVHARALATGGARPRDLLSAAAMRQSMATPPGFAAAWAHMLAFDLLAGRRIWEEGVREGRDTRLALVVTWAAGPLSLLLFPRLRALPHG
jgi:hypothetical protein